jgi:hypothetical protein
MNNLSFLYTKKEIENDTPLTKEYNLQHTGALYESAVIAFLRLCLSEQKNIRISDTGHFLDSDDCIVTNQTNKTFLKIQIKSVQSYTGDGLNKLGKAAKKKKDAWSIRNASKKDLEEYLKKGVDFIIFVYCEQVQTSYSFPVTATHKAYCPKLYFWIVPIEDAIKRRERETDKSDYYILKNDIDYQKKYFMRFDLLVEALNG